MSSWRSTTTGLLIGGVVIVILATAVSFGLSYFTKTTDVRFRSTVFSVKVAKDKASQEKGLAGVTELKQNGGLLMVFDSDDTWGIWMKDMKVSLDIVWLNSNKEVIYIVKNVSPDLSTSKTFKPTKPARYVLEVAAGDTSKYGVKIGDKADFDLGNGAN